jgi:hypothetical protein
VKIKESFLEMSKAFVVTGYHEAMNCEVLALD